MIPVPKQNKDGSYTFVAGITIDADGANGHDGSGRAAYGPAGTNPLDYLANAGHEGNWWGVVTQGGIPVIQNSTDPAEGYYISTTSYQRTEFHRLDPDRYLDSALEPFIVVPSHWRMAIKGVVLGCRAEVTNTLTKKTMSGVVGDFGPKDKLGEASMAMAKALGVNSNPKTGGDERKIYEYTIYPDSPAKGYKLQPANG